MRPYLLRAGTTTARPATDESIFKAEAKLGRHLPPSYTDVLRVQNGGDVRYDAFPTSAPTSWAKDHVPFDELYGIGGEHSILESTALIREWGLPPELVLLSGDGHTWVALDYRSNPLHATVTWIDCEAKQELALAPSFALFAQQLVRGLDRHVFGIVSPLTAPEAVAELLAPTIGAAFLASFAPPLLAAERADLSSRDGTDRGDFLLGPNLDEGELDFPEAPDCRWLLSADITDADARELERQLSSEFPLPVRKLHSPHFSA